MKKHWLLKTKIKTNKKKAFQFSTLLSRLDSEQQTAKQTIEANSDILNKVYIFINWELKFYVFENNLSKNLKLKSKLESNLESIKSSFDVINERIIAINSK